MAIGGRQGLDEAQNRHTGRRQHLAPVSKAHGLDSKIEQTTRNELQPTPSPWRSRLKSPRRWVTSQTTIKLPHHFSREQRTNAALHRLVHSLNKYRPRVTYQFSEDSFVSGDYSSHCLLQ